MLNLFLLIVLVSLLSLSLSKSLDSNSNSNSLYNVIDGNNKISLNKIKQSIIIKGGNIDDIDNNSDSSKVKHATDVATFDEILSSSANKLIVIDFSASWCMPCKMIAPMFDAMANSDEYKDVVFVKIDVDENPEISEKYQVMSMPTFLFIRDNEVIDRFSGASVEKLKETIDVLLKN